jgi:transitional endoplasmic reticulum ATPase
VANESDSNFISIKGPELVSKWVGESAAGIRKIFHKARQVSPCIIFFDEIDSIASKRNGDESGSGNKGYNNILNQILVEMDGLEPMEGVTVIAATNRPDILDPALLRPGRFDRILYVQVPDKSARKKILGIHSKGMPLEGVDFNKLAENTEGYTGADLEAVLREAAMIALREDINIKKITSKHIEKAMEKISPSVSKKDAERYKNIEKDYLRSAKAALPDKGPNYMG